MSIKSKISIKHGYFAMAFIFIFIILNCGFFESENGLEKDKNELNKMLDSYFVSYWKGAKLSYRSMPITKDSTIIDFKEIENEQKERLNLGPHLSKIFNNESFLKNLEKEKKIVYTAKELFELAKEIIYNVRNDKKYG